MLHSSWNDVVLQEYPGEIALAISLSGCKLACKGCHSSETFNSTFGTPLSPYTLQSLISKHPRISAVIFYGGEWRLLELLELIYIVQNNNLKSCLYTGLELNEVPKSLLNELDSIKTGKYVQELGGLSSETTNQQFIYLKGP